MSVIGSNIIAGASGTVETGYQIARSLRFNSADSAKLTRTPASAGNRKTWTWSGWVKRTTLGDQYVFEVPDGGSTGFHIRFNASDQLRINDYTVGTDYTYLLSSAVYRDVSAWYHIVVAFDTTQATSSNRTKIYVNGVQVTAFASSTYCNQNQDTAVNSTKQHEYSTGNKYVADTYLIDGQALTPSSFGETDSATGVWVPKAYTGTYGTNGFWLKFDDNSGVTATTLGKDSSGNGNNWTPNNFSVTAGVGNDSLVDSPTNYGTDTGAGGEVRGNYATFNPLDAGSNLTFADGNLQISSSANPNNNCRGTLGVASGKWYWEVTPTAGAGGTVIGIASDTASVTTNFSGDLYGYDSNGNKQIGATGSAYGATYGTNDVIGVAFDADNRTITFYKNNASQGTISSITSGLTWRPFVHANSKTVVANFGQRPFAYTAPSGFKALCTQNLPTPAIGASASTLASKNMNVAVWSGNGTSQTITGVGFQPDLTWFKRRSAAGDHALYDVIRGGNKSLGSNTTTAEITELFTIGFNSDGYSLPTGDNQVNGSGITYVGWSWKANGAGVSNTAGSISSTVSANQTAGISIVKWTVGSSNNQTVGHGLGVAPKFIITKNRNTAYGWACYVGALTNPQNGYLDLQTTGAFTTSSSSWNNTAPTSSVFTVGTASWWGSSTDSMIAYCFAEIAGFSKFGSYTGNGSADGPFVYCGFRPRWIMIKSTGVESWGIWDAARDTYNFVQDFLLAQSSNAEQAGPQGVDILSNGFKVRGNYAINNSSGQGYIFIAFAENPFNYSRAR